MPETPSEVSEMPSEIPEAVSELSVSLWRGGKEGRYQTYAVPRRDNQTVLDIVTFVQRHIDPTLTYRFACRVGVCGSCAMTVNGRPRWTCRTHVAKVAGDGGKLEIAPLENLPIIKDLATDMQAFFEKWQNAQGVFAPTRTRLRPPCSTHLGNEPHETSMKISLAYVDDTLWLGMAAM